MTGIYHSKDLDGFCCAWLMERYHPGLRLIGYDYGEPYEDIIDSIPIGEYVVMADISLPMEGMEALARAARLTWVDHHKSAISAFEAEGEWTKLATTYLDPSRAACEILWEALKNPHQSDFAEIASVVTLLGSYDVFREYGSNYWKDYILPFQYGMRARHFGVNKFPGFHVFTPEYIQGVIDTGAMMLEWDRARHKSVLKKAFAGDLCGHTCLYVNAQDAGTTFFESYEGYEEFPVLCSFYFDGTFWRFSIRGNNMEGVDCSAIAAKFGGGGHLNAAGFRVKLLSEVFDNM